MTRLRHFSKSQRALHPITWVLFLVIILIAIAGIAYIWTVTTEKAGLSIFIQSISFQETNTKIYVQNTGTGQVTLYSIQIDNQTFSVLPTNCTIGTIHTTALDPSQTAEISINQSYKQQVHIKVTCKEGTFHESNYKP